MKKCHNCGKALHEQASFCPYCMQSQIPKQSTVIQTKQPGKRLYAALLIGLLLILLAVLLWLLMRGREERSDYNEGAVIPSTESAAAAEAASSTAAVTAITTEEEGLTTTVQTTAEAVIETLSPETVPPETVSQETSLQETAFQLGDYITEGKTLSQIQGYGGTGELGGIVLTIAEITDTVLTFSIVQYSESGYASDTVSARNITAEVMENTAEFTFRDMLGGEGSGKMTIQDGVLSIETWSSSQNPTSMLVNTRLTPLT